MKLTQEEKNAIYYSISLQLGFIETGTLMRAQDALKCGKKDIIRVLTTTQMKNVIFLEELMNKILDDREE